MKRILLLLVISTLFGVIFAQQDECNCQSGDDYSVSLLKGLIGEEYQNPLLGYTGDHFFGSWAKGEVVFINGEKITDIPLRFEEYLNELLWLRDGDFKSGILHKSVIAGFKLYDKQGNITASFVRRKIRLPFDTDSTFRYLQVLEPGKIGLYAYRSVNVVPNDNKLQANTRYLCFSGDHFEILRLKRTDVINLPVIDKEKMKAILRSNKIAVNGKEYEMARAFRLYNSQ